MQFEPKLTLDGLMTLLAGVIAFVAVIIQIRSSSGQVREQITAQRESEREERERQKKAVATAILFEIDDFYRYHVPGVYDYLEERAKLRELIEVVRVPPSLFAVYRGNTSRLGDLPDEVVEAVVHFYSKAEQFFALREDYRAEREKHPEPPTDSAKWKVTTLFGHLRDSLPGLTMAAYIPCKRLSDFTGIGFESPRIAITGEDFSALTRQAEQIEHEEVHRI